MRCAALLARQHSNARPLAGDGVDVPIEAGGTTWTFDVALVASDGSLILAECRRRVDPAKQDEVAAFAYKVERIRETLRVPVAGSFMVKARPQLGVLKVGAHEGISIGVFSDDREENDFNIVFHRYDPERDKRLRDVVMSVAPGTYRNQGAEVTFLLERKDRDPSR